MIIRGLDCEVIVGLVGFDLNGLVSSWFSLALS